VLALQRGIYSVFNSSLSAGRQSTRASLDACRCHTFLLEVFEISSNASCGCNCANLISKGEAMALFELLLSTCNSVLEAIPYLVKRFNFFLKRFKKIASEADNRFPSVKQWLSHAILVELPLSTVASVQEAIPSYVKRFEFHLKRFKKIAFEGVR